MIGRKEMINKSPFYFGMYLTELSKHKEAQEKELIYMLEGRTTISRTLENYKG